MYGVVHLVLNGCEKLCGVLCEMQSEPDFTHFVVVGIGINDFSKASTFWVNVPSISRKEIDKTALGAQNTVAWEYHADANNDKMCKVWF